MTTSRRPGSGPGRAVHRWKPPGAQGCVSRHPAAAATPRPAWPSRPVHPARPSASRSTAPAPREHPRGRERSNGEPAHGPPGPRLQRRRSFRSTRVIGNLPSCSRYFMSRFAVLTLAHPCRPLKSLTPTSRRFHPYNRHNPPTPPAPRPGKRTPCPVRSGHEQIPVSEYLRWHRSPPRAG